MEDNDNPAEVKDITIPSSFNGKQFCEEIEAHFADHALHPLKSALRKLENQYSECFKSSIVGVFESKSYVSKIKYRLLFVMHHFNLESFRLETTAFLRSVEREVLPAPLTPSNLSVTIAAPPDQGSVQPAALPAASPSTSAPVDADAAAQYTMRKLLRTDWSEERRAAKGPYAPPPPETATPQKEKARGTKKAKSKRSRLLREIDADGDDTDEQGVEDEVRSVQKVRRNGQVQHASSEKASSAVRAANSLAANRKHFVGVMEARDPLTEALGSTVEGHDVRSAVGGWKTKTRQASAAAPGHEEGHSASKKSPGSTSKKKSLMESRAGASTVDFSDSNEDMDSDAGFQKEEDSKIAGQRSRIEVG
ncbi:unnamed protein product [Symbiodinium microadriaticum]|nr:unnamed protein product [Symbiodinium microadriaticum]